MPSLEDLIRNCPPQYKMLPGERKLVNKMLDYKYWTKLSYEKFLEMVNLTLPMFARWLAGGNPSGKATNKVLRPFDMESEPSKRQVLEKRCAGNFAQHVLKQIIKFLGVDNAEMSGIDALLHAGNLFFLLPAGDPPSPSADLNEDENSQGADAGELC